MDDAPESICLEISRYLEKKQASPETPWADAQGSLSRSRECACRLCRVACQCVGDESDIERNKRANVQAVGKNSILSFDRSEDSSKEEDDYLTAEFKTSGLNFTKGKRYATPKSERSKEVFVVHRKLVSSNGRMQLTLW
jgi:hypothetical protein